MTAAPTTAGATADPDRRAPDGVGRARPTSASGADRAGCAGGAARRGGRERSGAAHRPAGGHDAAVVVPTGRRPASAGRGSGSAAASPRTAPADPSATGGSAVAAARRRAAARRLRGALGLADRGGRRGRGVDRRLAGVRLAPAATPRIRRRREDRQPGRRRERPRRRVGGHDRQPLVVDQRLAGEEPEVDPRRRDPRAVRQDERDPRPGRRPDPRRRRGDLVVDVEVDDAVGHLRQTFIARRTRRRAASSGSSVVWSSIAW